MSELLMEKRSAFHIIHDSHGELHLAFTDEAKKETLKKIKEDKENERK